MEKFPSGISLEKYMIVLPASRYIERPLSRNFNAFSAMSIFFINIYGGDP